MFFIFTFFKSFVVQLIPFLLRFWREIIIAVMLMLWQHEKSSHRATTQQLATLKQDIATKTAQSIFENGLKEQIAAKQIAKSNEVHQNQLNQVREDYEKRTKTNITTIADLRNQLTHQLRDQPHSFELGMSEAATDTSVDPEKWRDRYTTVVNQYETLSDACTITTLDFEALRAWADEAVFQVGTINH